MSRLELKCGLLMAALVCSLSGGHVQCHLVLQVSARVCLVTLATGDAIPTTPKTAEFITQAPMLLPGDGSWPQVRTWPGATLVGPMRPLFFVYSACTTGRLLLAGCAACGHFMLQGPEHPPPTRTTRHELSPDPYRGQNQVGSLCGAFAASLRISRHPMRPLT